MIVIDEINESGKPDANVRCESTKWIRRNNWIWLLFYKKGMTILAEEKKYLRELISKKICGSNS